VNVLQHSTCGDFNLFIFLLHTYFLQSLDPTDMHCTDKHQGVNINNSALRDFAFPYRHCN